MAQLIYVRDEAITGDSFYISIDENQLKFLKWLAENEYITGGVYFDEKDKIDEVIDLT